LRIPISPNWQTRPHVKDDHTQVVYPMHMIGMGMGIDHRIQSPGAGVKQLRTQIRRGVDQDGGDALWPDAFHQHRTASPSVAWIGRITRAPMPAKPWDPAGRAAAQNGKAELIAHATACTRAAL